MGMGAGVMRAWLAGICHWRGSLVFFLLLQCLVLYGLSDRPLKISHQISLLVYLPSLHFATLSSSSYQRPNIQIQIQIINSSQNTLSTITMCLFSSPKKHHRRYVEEVYVAPRPVSRHSHHSHHHGHGSHGRSSYTSVTRTSRPVSREYIAPRMSQSSYRRSVPVVVEQRHSTRSYRGWGLVEGKVELWRWVLQYAVTASDVWMAFREDLLAYYAKL
ncbi:hypothetical protein VTL71DRAFT_9768 [Oculimacula yallundae]|uniref:Uncharacterized protein n=1 Tax=Oculimacula yallundae TaxID=86028 RepID=A0ABR4BRS1_9HELO